MEGAPKQKTEEEVLALEKSRVASESDFLEEGASFKIGLNGEKELILTDEQIVEMKALDEKYSVEKSNKLENEPLRDLSGDIETFSSKERTKQILGGLDRFKDGLGIAIGVPAIATITSFGFMGGGDGMNQPDFLPYALGSVAVITAIGSIFTNDSFKEMANGVKIVFKAIKGEKYDPEFSGYHNPNY